MGKKWTQDTALVASLTSNLLDMLPLFPQKLVKVDEIVREQGMPYSNIRILILLSEGELSITQLSERLGIAKPNITPLVDHMLEQGLVERTRNARDKRIVHVHLLPAGEERVAAIREGIAEQIAKWPGEFSKSEIKELNNAMASIIRISQHME